MLKQVLASVALIAAGLFSTPALAGRTAIDQNPDGTPLTYYLSGYCDFNGDECGDGNGLFLPYSFSIGGSAFTNRVVVQGNGLLTFGGAVQFLDNLDVSNEIYYGGNPDLTAYNLNLVSAGQNNQLDFGSFFQSAALKRIAGTNRIKADWFTCFAPSGPGVCPRSSVSSVTLTPTKKGFLGHFDGTYDDVDRGFVSNGVYTHTGEDFFLPATFQGLTAGVPEPASWALMIAGFGLVGAMSRRRDKSSAIAQA